MSMPGFSAEASIGGSRGTYRVGLTSGTETRGSVLLQILHPIYCGPCVWDVYDFGVPTCAKICKTYDPTLQKYVETVEQCDPSQCPSSNCCPPGCVQC
jgi:hypothetical protein